MGSGVIQRGEVGTDISYTAAGERRTAQAGSGAEEVYSYDLEGRLASVEIDGVTRAQTGYDLLGRVTSYGEYDASGFGVHSRYGIVYDARGLVLAEKSSTRQGSDWIHTHTVNSYSDTGTGAPTPMISAPGQVRAMARTPTRTMPTAIPARAICGATGRCSRWWSWSTATAPRNPIPAEL